MPRNIKGIKIFVGSAGGLDHLRKEFREIIEQYNRLEALPLQVYFEAIGWEDTLPSTRQRGQAEINEQLRGCDYALFLFRDRWGTPPNVPGATPAYSSGAEEEYAVAGECIAAKTMLDRSVFFLPVPASQLKDPGAQLQSVLAFKQRLIDEKNCLFQHLNDDAQFGEVLRGLLGQWRRTHEPRSAVRDAADGRIGALAEAASLTLPNVPASSSTANTDHAFDQIASALKKSLDDKDFAGALALAPVAHELATQPANIAWAMFAQGFTLGVLERSAEAITQYDELIARFGAASEPALRERVAKAMLNKGVTLGVLERSAEAITQYDDVISRFGAASEPALREVVAKAMFNKGTTLGQAKRIAEAMTQFDELIARFAAASEPALREQAAEAMLYRGATLGQLERLAEAMAQFDELIVRFAATSEPALREVVANATFYKGVVLGKLERHAEAMAQYDELIARFAATSEPALREVVARAMLNKGVALGKLKRHAEAMVLYDEVIARFAANSEPALREVVARAMLNKGVTLDVFDSAKAITQYDELIARFAAASEPALRELVAKAMLDKSARLGVLDGSAEAITQYDELIARFAAASEPALKDLVAKARSAKDLLTEQNPKQTKPRKTGRKR